LTSGGKGWIKAYLNYPLRRFKIMTIKDQLNADLKEAMKSGDKTRLETIRLLRSAIKYAEIEVGHELDDEGLLDIIGKQAKQRRDAIVEFEKGGRTDLVEKEIAELAILEQYLPAQMSEDEVREKVQAIITALGVTDLKGLGQVMKQAMTELKGQADGKIVNQIARQLLTH
jgi:hypothetical protein